MEPDDRLGSVSAATCSISTPPSAEPMSRIRSRRPVEDGREVELLGDVRRRGDEDLPDGDALDVHAEDRPGHGLGLVRGVGELDAAGLAAPADEHLGLDHDGSGAGSEHALRGRSRVGDGPGHLPSGDGQALRDEQSLGVGFLDLHAPLGSSLAVLGGWSGREGEWYPLRGSGDRDGQPAR